MSTEIWNTYEMALAATTGGLIVGVAAVGLMVLKRLDGSREVATARGWWEKAIAVQALNDRARWAPAYSENRHAIEADKPQDAEVLHVAYPTQELRLVADDPQVAAGLAALADEVGLVQAVGCCTGHGDEPCAEDSGIVPPFCCDDCPDRLPALSDRPAEDDDEVGDEQPGEARWSWLRFAAATLLFPFAWLAFRVSPAVEYVADKWAEFWQQWAERNQVGSGEQAQPVGRTDEDIAAEIAVLTGEPADDPDVSGEWALHAAITDGPDTAEPVNREPYRGRRLRDEHSTRAPGYWSRHMDPDFQTGAWPVINIPTQRDGGDE